MIEFSGVRNSWLMLARKADLIRSAASARSRATGGSGLGLAITKHCVQECGGTISVWSREGEGSTFTIELPVAPEPDDDGGERADDGEAPGETVGAPGAGDAATQE